MGYKLEVGDIININNTPHTLIEQHLVINPLTMEISMIGTPLNKDSGELSIGLLDAYGYKHIHNVSTVVGIGKEVKYI